MDFRRRVRAALGREVATPKGILRRAFERLLRDLDGNACMLAVVMDELVEGPDSYIHVVGANERLLTVGVVPTTVQRLGGYEQPWEALYYRRFARTEAEREFFRKWIGLLADAREAPGNSEARVGEDLYVSWAYVQELAESHLQRAVTKLRQRFKDEGPQEEHDWREQPLPAEEPSALVQLVKEQHDSS